MEELKKRLSDFLGVEGKRFFRACRILTKSVSPALKVKLLSNVVIPHPVHFREGMTIRNWLREQPECKDWTTDDFDNKWAGLVAEVITPLPIKPSDKPIVIWGQETHKLVDGTFEKDVANSAAELAAKAYKEIHNV